MMGRGNNLFRGAMMAGMLATLTATAEEPILRAGILTDTHIGKTEDSCRLVKRAFQFFRKQETNMVIHLGDVADQHYPEGYRIYRRLFQETFPEQKPLEVILYANHDAVGCPNQQAFFRDFQRELDIPHQPYHKMVVKGYPFLIFPQDVELEFPKMTQAIQQAIQEFPEKPVFVLHHCPMFNTVAGSKAGLCLEGRPVLDQFPQVVHLSGHTHGSLRNENNIHQDTYTTVNAGCLQYWQGNQVGMNLPNKAAAEVLLLEVYPEKLLFRRYSLLDGSEIGADNPWCVPWPFNRESAPYNPKRRKASLPPPAFPKAGSITLQPTTTPASALTFTFPEAHEPEGCYLYRAELERQNKDTWETFACKEDYSDFYLQDKWETMEFAFSAAFFEPNKQYRIRITPINFFGIAGAPLALTFTPEKLEQGKILFQSEQPEKDCRYLAKKGTEIPCIDGWYHFKDWNSLGALHFPDHIWDSVPDDTLIRLSVELEQEQPHFPRKRLWVGKDGFKRATSESIFLREGTTPREKIVFEFWKKHGEHYTLLVSHGIQPGPIKFHRVRIEALNR